MSAERVSLDDLAFAIDWLDNGYEGDEGEDENVASAKRVAAMLRAEMTRRAEAANVRILVRDHGVTPERARAALRKHRPA